MSITPERTLNLRLLKAVCRVHVDINEIDMLLHAGANVNFLYEGDTAIGIAAFRGNFLLVKYLISKGAELAFGDADVSIICALKGLLIFNDTNSRLIWQYLLQELYSPKYIAYADDIYKSVMMKARLIDIDIAHDERSLIERVRDLAHMPNLIWHDLILFVAGRHFHIKFNIIKKDTYLSTLSTDLIRYIIAPYCILSTICQQIYVPQANYYHRPYWKISWSAIL